MVRLMDTQIRYDDAWTLDIDGAQVEVDAGFENHEEFFIFECKNWYRGQLRDFNIRQLFFPQLHALNMLHADGRNWRVRCFFLNIEPDTSTYRFWEYAFADAHDYSSMGLLKRSAYRLVQDKSSSPSRLLDQFAQVPLARTKYIPQANDPNKLLALIQGIAEGYDTVDEIADRMKFDPRQSNYYGEAAEELGLIDRGHGGRFALTGTGSDVARLQTDAATHALIERIFTLPVFHEIAETSVKEKKTVLDTDSLLPILKRSAKRRYNDTTLHRRVQCVARWVNWIGETTGTIRVRTTPKIRPELRTLDTY
jgi:hypothetical protein